MAEKKSLTSVKYDPTKFYFVPMGGSEQFGVNCNLYIHNNDWLLIDLGMGFADEKSPGIDILLPDLDYIIENKDKLCGLIITHAHEDHIGAVPYLWPRLRCPIFCTAFTAEVLHAKFAEYPDCKGAVITIIDAGEKRDIGSFNTEFIRMAHSIPDTVAVNVTTDKLKAFHSADWNLDATPVIGKTTDMKTIERLGKDGIDVYIGDSTNSLVPGRAGSEKAVEQGMANTIGECTGKVVVTIFSSNISRIQSVCRAAKEHSRHVAVLGRSLHRMIGCAKHAGYLNDIDDFVDEEDIELIPDDRLVVIATGSQGEPRAAMARIARGDWQGLKLGENDSVIFSSREIPGNEKAIEVIKNNLVAAGVDIIDPTNAKHTIHVSGHPYRDEIYEMMMALKPRSVIPVHGEYIQLSGQAEVAKGCGITDIRIPTNGSVIEIGRDKLEIAGHVPTGLLGVEPKRVLKIDHMGIRERRKLQYAGVAHVTVVLDERGGIMADPELTIIGLIDESREADLKLEDAIYEEILGIYEDMTLEERLDDDFAREQFRIGIRRFINHALGFKPVTNVHLVRV